LPAKKTLGKINSFSLKTLKVINLFQLKRIIVSLTENPGTTPQHPGVNFINVLQAAFAPVDPKSVKDIDDLTKFLCFWELLA